MRKYQSQHVGALDDPTHRSEELRRERFLEQVSQQLAKLGNGAAKPPALQVVSNINPPPGGPPLPDHDHSRSGLGGNTLGDPSKTINARGIWWYQYRIGVNTSTPLARLHVKGDPPGVVYTTFIGDITTPGTWTTDSGAGLPWYTHIDETPAGGINASDFLLTANPANVSQYEGQLAAVPAAGSLTISIHAKCASGAQATNFQLVESVTSRFSTNIILSTTPTTYSFTLSGAQYAAIGNFSNLRLRFGYDGSGSGSISQITFYAAWVETPGVGVNVPAVIVQANATQTTNLAEFQNSAGTSLISITSAGRLTIESGGSMRFVPGAGANKVPVSNASGDLTLTALTLFGSIFDTVGTPSAGDIIFRNGSSQWARLAIGSAGNVLTVAAGLPSWAAPTAVAHNLLSATHPDTVVQSPVKGKLIVGNTTPAWDGLAVGANGTVLTADSTVGVGVKWATTVTSELEMIGLYGDGSDGTVTLDGATDYAATTGINLIAGAYFMTRDVYFDSLTINNTISLETGGWRIFVKNTLTNNGIIHRAPGAAGGNGANAGGAGTGGTAGGGITDDGSTAMGGSPNGRAGRTGGTGLGLQGFAGLQATGEGGSGGAGGAGEDNAFGGAGGAAQATTTTLTKKWRNVGILLQWSFLALVSGGSGGSSGASGAGDGVARGAGGGGSGGGGGVVGIWARVFSNGATGIVRANGSAGGNGGNFNANSGSGGGGGGGGGGFIYFINDSFTNSGTIQAAGGAAGLHGTNGTLGGNVSTDGAAGGAGTIVKYNRLTGVFS